MIICNNLKDQPVFTLISSDANKEFDSGDQLHLLYFLCTEVIGILASSLPWKPSVPKLMELPVVKTSFPFPSMDHEH